MTGKRVRTASWLDRLSIITGNTISWLTLAMVLVTCVVVVLRYIFGIGFIWLQESVTWMHAAVFMLGMAYTLQQDEHVRVDIFYREMTDTRRAVVNLFGVLLFLLPLCTLLIYVSWDYVLASWSVKEASPEAGGLPYPFIPLLKTLLLVMPALIALQSMSMLLRAWSALRSS